MDDSHNPGNEIAQEIAHTIARKIAIGIALLIAFVLFVVLGGVLVQWLWNWLVPDLFGLRRLTVWEALGLLALSRILFGGFGRGGGSHGPSRRRKEWWTKRGEEQITKNE
jgi:hypothetical protein